jgi:succinate-semialdehyde dehydrogenase / glutarate-semialdehyde dehydrogenase
MRYETINPATEEVLGRHATLPAAEVQRRLARCTAAQRDWRDTPLPARARGLEALAAALRRRAPEHARLITLEMGKPIAEALAEVEKCAWLAEVYAREGSAWLADECVAADGFEHRVVYEPLGVILAVMPWNFPFWQALRCAVPALLAGNAVLLKLARNVPQCALAIETAVRDAGFPPDLLGSVAADHAAVARLIADDRVRGIALTGSTAAGARIAQLAGKHLKKVVLELGGADPFVVLADAEVESAARGALRGRMLNAGQSCIAAKRFIVAREIASPFTRRLAELAAALRVGDPLAPETQIGPLVDAAALRALAAQLAASVASGARVLTGGARLPRRGYYFAPTVVADVAAPMPLWREEVFGPIAPVMVARDEPHAIELANATEFGLGASIWTRDAVRGASLARRIEAGTVFVNAIVKSDPRMPFGGVKRSGFGRELARHGLLEFMNVKGVNVYAAGGG